MLATLVLKSKNGKIGRVAATYASIEGSCPKDCALRDAGCYAQTAFVGITTARLNASVKRSTTPEKVAREEATLILDAIARHRNRTPLRLHVAGDCRTDEAARILSDSVREWGHPVWTYTHAWKTVQKAAWGAVSVLASIDRPQEAWAALERGYAPARVVPAHPTDGKATVESGIRWIPCPEQTGRAESCDACKLCWQSEALVAQGAGISFAAHGSRENTIKRRLSVIRE